MPKFLPNLLPSFCILIFLLLQTLTAAYELRSVKFEGRCQLWYSNARGRNQHRVQVYFFYDPAPFLVARNWRTGRKFLFIHPENKKLFQLNQNSMAKASCNVAEDAMEIPPANQTIHSTDSYYRGTTNWRSDYSYYDSRTMDTFDDNVFRQNQNKIARFLQPNGTEQLYQVWRDKTAKKVQCKVSLVHENQNQLNVYRTRFNQLTYPGNYLRSTRVYPLYNCLVASSSCRSYHVFLVNEDDMSVYEVNIVEQPNYERRWDMISSNSLGQFWSNGSFFPERRKHRDEFTDHCSYAQDFVPLSPQQIGRNPDLIKPAPETVDELEEEEEENGPNQAEVDDDGNDSSEENDQNVQPPTPSRPTRRNGSTKEQDRNNNNGSNGRIADPSGKKRTNLNRGNNTSPQINEGLNTEDANIDKNSSTDIDASSQESDDDDDQDEDQSDNGDIKVNTGNQISIGGGGKNRGKFTFNDNNSISISGTGKRSANRPKINMNRQTSIKMRRKK